MLSIIKRSALLVDIIKCVLGLLFVENDRILSVIVILAKVVFGNAHELSLIRLLQNNRSRAVRLLALL